MEYVAHIIVMLALYSMLTLSLNIVVGMLGYLSLAHAAFFGCGAYLCAILTKAFGLTFFVALPLALIGTGLVSAVVAVLSFRFRGDLFVIATLGFQLVTRVILNNWTSVSGGPFGVVDIPAPGILGHEVRGTTEFLALVVITAIVVSVTLARLIQMPYGRVLRAVRDDEVVAASLGKNVAWFKVSAFVIAATAAAVPGALYASYTSYIDPSSFGLDESIFILTALIIGGGGNVRGPLAGALVMVLLPEALRFLALPDAAAANLRQVLLGASMVLMMRYRPQGIAGVYAFD